MSTFFELFVTYSQVAVFDPDTQDPFNDWTPQHVAQGFSWRPESVSFGTLDDGGLMKVEVEEADHVAIKDAAERAILVPFEVWPPGKVEVAPIDRGRVVAIPRGRYALVFETGHGSDGIMWAKFTFVPRDDVRAEVLRADSALTLSYPLLMWARSA